MTERIVYYNNYNMPSLKKTNIKIVQKLRNNSFLNVQILQVLLDEGSHLSFLNSKYVNMEHDNMKLLKLKKVEEFSIFDTLGNILTKIDTVITGDIFIDVYNYTVKNANIYLAHDITQNGIIGMDILHPIRNHLADPAYINNIIKKPIMTYDDVLISLSGTERLHDKNNNYIVNKSNIFLIPYERKMISVYTGLEMKSNVKIALLQDLKPYLGLDKFEFKKKQDCLSLQNKTDKVLCIRRDFPLAKEIICDDINELIMANFPTKSSKTCNHLVTISELPEDEQKFYLKERMEWKARREKFIKENPMIEEINLKAEKSDYETAKLSAILKEYNDIFCRNSKDVGFAIKYLSTIIFQNTDHKPIYLPPYKKKFEIQEKIGKELQLMEDAKFIEKAISSYS